MTFVSFYSWINYEDVAYFNEQEMTAEGQIAMDFIADR